VDLRPRPSQPELAGEPRPRCSVGIMAYNEEANIADAIDAILRPAVGSSRVAELIVVASGCEDRTTAIVSEISRSDPRVRLIEQQRREGKASAINCFIGAARSPILVLIGADVLVTPDTVDALLEHFRDAGVGMVGGRPVPVNSDATFVGHAVNLQWRLHDRIARDSPKLGEIVAFRNVIPEIPLDTAVDELSIHCLISQLGYRAVYEPRAVVYNRGPATAADFLRQRRRIHAGHLHVRRQEGYSASTMSAWRVGRAFAGAASFATPRAATWSLGTAGLEAIARALGRYDHVRGKPHHVWDVVATTKSRIAEGAGAQTQQSVLIFHIDDFHRHRLEHGARASRQLSRRVTDHIKSALGSDATVSVPRPDTFVAVRPGDRETAERSARELAGRPLALNGHARIDVILDCAVVAFSQEAQ
jgi:poly-beta-1,6-N-acetyl-D-glucosamine synthase